MPIISDTASESFTPKPKHVSSYAVADKDDRRLVEPTAKIEPTHPLATSSKFDLVSSRASQINDVSELLDQSSSTMDEVNHPKLH
jgi:hypothetical protein